VGTGYGELVDRLRAAARPDRPAPPGLDAYLEKVRNRAHAITDVDVEQARTAGFSEEEIFEHTVSAAVESGLERLDAALQAMQ